jgi:hypothetical protein
VSARDIHEHPDTARLEACVQDKPVTTGAGLSGILQEWAVRHTQSELGLRHRMKLAAISGANGVFSEADFERVRTLATAADEYQNTH